MLYERCVEISNRDVINMEQLRLESLRGAYTIGISWTISGPGQPLHVHGKGCPQMAATAPMGQERHIEKTPKTPVGKFHIDRY